MRGYMRVCMSSAPNSNSQGEKPNLRYNPLAIVLLDKTSNVSLQHPLEKANRKRCKYPVTKEYVILVLLLRTVHSQVFVLLPAIVLKSLDHGTEVTLPCHEYSSMVQQLRRVRDDGQMFVNVNGPYQASSSRSSSSSSGTGSAAGRKVNTAPIANGTAVWVKGEDEKWGKGVVTKRKSAETQR